MAVKKQDVSDLDVEISDLSDDCNINELPQLNKIQTKIGKNRNYRYMQENLK